MNLERVQKYYELIDRELGLESKKNDDIIDMVNKIPDLL